MARDKVSREGPGHLKKWQGWLIVIAIIGVLHLPTLWDEFVDVHTSIGTIIRANRPIDVIDDPVDLKVVQISEHDPVRYWDDTGHYHFVVYDHNGDSIIVSIRGDKIDFRPKPGDYVSVRGRVGSAQVGVWTRSLNLYIGAYDVRRVRGF